MYRLNWSYGLRLGRFFPCNLPFPFPFPFPFAFAAGVEVEVEVEAGVALALAVALSSPLAPETRGVKLACGTGSTAISMRGPPFAAPR